MFREVTLFMVKKKNTHVCNNAAIITPAVIYLEFKWIKKGKKNGYFDIRKYLKSFR